MMQTSAVGRKKDFQYHQGFCFLLYSKEKLRDYLRKSHLSLLSARKLCP